ncbi:MAG: outer membrane protein assembly factor BamE, partial [Pseudomonadales bacterium]|nr:outer membrane protein assembly factor BamE [Pseudomonadales bacterium]
YVYSIQIRGGDPVRKKLILHFVDNRLSHFEGDYVPTSEKEAVETADAG